MTRWPAICALVGVLGFVVSERSARAIEPFVLYDDFNGAGVDAEKWLGAEGSSLLGRDAGHFVQNGQARLKNRSVGFTATDSGVGANFVILAVPNPAAVTQMKATVATPTISITGCAGNTQSIDGTAATVIGSFFNTGTPTNGDQTNDVIAEIGIFAAPGSIAATHGARVLGVILQCTDATCDTFNIVGGADFGSIAVGAATTVGMIWDAVTHQFTFHRNGASDVQAPYNLSDTSSPGLPFKGLEAINRVANCTTTPRPVADVLATFDDFFVNQSAIQ